VLILISHIHSMAWDTQGGSVLGFPIHVRYKKWTLF
jgi:hypothetical protein